jgi:hypothetical protein
MACKLLGLNVALKNTLYSLYSPSFFSLFFIRYPDFSDSDASARALWGDNGSKTAPCNKTYGQRTLDFSSTKVPRGRDHVFAGSVWDKIKDDLCVDVRKDGQSFDVKLWVPGSDAFTALHDAVKLDGDKKVTSIVTKDVEKCVQHPVFIPSYGRAPQGAYLHWGSDGQADGECTTAVRILVVRHDQYDVYKRHWGKECLVLQLPRQMTHGEITVTAEDGKIGFSRCLSLPQL